MDIKPNFTSAAALLPPSIRWRHHGRTLGDGLDCAGLVIWMYRTAGRSIDRFDLPYSVRSMRRMLEQGMVEARCDQFFGKVTEDVRNTVDQDGDIWFFRQGELPHLGVQVNGIVLHMTDRLNRVRAGHLRPLLQSAYRLT